MLDNIHLTKYNVNKDNKTAYSKGGTYHGIL